MWKLRGFGFEDNKMVKYEKVYYYLSVLLLTNPIVFPNLV